MGLVLFAAARMEWRRGYAGVEVLLCMCDSRATVVASAETIGQSSQLRSKTTLWSFYIVRHSVRKSVYY